MGQDFWPGLRLQRRRKHPRAIFQFNPGTDDCVLEGFELSGAHNPTHNGAGVRINQANRVTVRSCSIHHNDMGIMSNGDGTLQSAVDQRIEFCEIHHNGDLEHPGFNHNLYLGGTSATLRFCQVYGSLTGHNIKSRANHTRVEYCYVHHSANREFDLVDAAETAFPDSHAVVVGNLIVKDPQCRGNRAVIHFGRDGGKEHDGTLYLVFNTIVTPFLAPVVELSTAKAQAELTGNLISDGGSRQANQALAAVRNGAALANVRGTTNWFSGDYAASAGATGLDPAANRVQRFAGPMFVDPAQHDYRLVPAAALLAKTRLAPGSLRLPPVPGMSPAGALHLLAWQFRMPADKQARAERALTLGALSSQIHRP